MSKWNEEDVKADYCAAILSIQMVAAKHGMGKTTLIDLARKRGWIREKATAKSAKKKPTKPTKPTKKTDQNKNGRSGGRSVTASENVDENGLATEDEKSSTTEVNLSFDPAEFGLSEQQAIFAQHVAAGKTRVDAYRLARYISEGNAAYVTASQLLRNPKVSRAVRFLRDQRQMRYAADLDKIVGQLVAITQADPNELSQYRRVNCRYCWGENHLYQWRDIQEFDRAAAKAAKDGKAEPEYGGLGFVDNADPNPDCPKCNGEGCGELFFGDTRNLAGTDERWIYAGAKKTKDGIELMMHDQAAARRDLIRILTARAGGGGDKTPAVSYTPDDYKRAAQQLDDEFGDLD